MPPTPDGDLGYLERTLERSQEVMRDLREAQVGILRVIGRAGGDGGLVRAESDGQGGITRLELEPDALRLTPQDLGRRITTVLQAAQRDAVRQTQEIADRALAATAALAEPLDDTFVRLRVDRAARDPQ
ncbi:YbaB/EbfC family nucleoid-associated protein [Nonomuraea sp. NN258]|uniref:YbaB/EbfC family nucleoid-associated protein n=1 Tax=Nonomuraea antri TaxID=2730852 RepID=UPI0015680CEF|nr:YbaB/EbfC family nucleoid-associated protein [Nonomuraea antri]NRQ39450.1 YbaB/EbfC family nucleoid-associated protein [Nonomuraea antri]